MSEGTELKIRKKFHRTKKRERERERIQSKSKRQVTPEGLMLRKGVKK